MRRLVLLLTVGSKGLIARRLADGNKVVDPRLVFSLYKVLHYFGGRLLRLRGGYLCC